MKQEFKGVFYNKKKETHFYEGGAHFKYQELYQALTTLKQSMQTVSSQSCKNLLDTKTKLKQDQSSSNRYSYLKTNMIKANKEDYTKSMPKISQIGEKYNSNNGNNKINLNNSNSNSSSHINSYQINNIHVKKLKFDKLSDVHNNSVNKNNNLNSLLNLNNNLSLINNKLGGFKLNKNIIRLQKFDKSCIDGILGKNKKNGTNGNQFTSQFIQYYKNNSIGNCNGHINANNSKLNIKLNLNKSKFNSMYINKNILKPINVPNKTKLKNEKNDALLLNKNSTVIGFNNNNNASLSCHGKNKSNSDISFNDSITFYNNMEQLSQYLFYNKELNKRNHSKYLNEKQRKVKNRLLNHSTIDVKRSNI